MLLVFKTSNKLENNNNPIFDYIYVRRENVAFGCRKCKYKKYISCDFFNWLNSKLKKIWYHSTFMAIKRHKTRLCLCLCLRTYSFQFPEH